MVKNSTAVCVTWVGSLGWEDPLEEGMATHASILAWRIPLTEESGRLQSMGSQRVGHHWAPKHILVYIQNSKSRNFTGNLPLKLYTLLHLVPSLSELQSWGKGCTGVLQPVLFPDQLGLGLHPRTNNGMQGKLKLGCLVGHPWTRRSWGLRRPSCALEKHG